jgi:hypothetical protein
MTSIERGLLLRKKVKAVGVKLDADFIGLKGAVQRLPEEAKIDLNYILDIVLGMELK